MNKKITQAAKLLLALFFYYFTSVFFSNHFCSLTNSSMKRIVTAMPFTILNGKTAEITYALELDMQAK